MSDNADDKLYAYALSDFSRDSGKDIDLHSDNGEARGIWSDGATIWVLDRDDEKIYAYLLSDGSRDSGLDIDLDGAGVNYNSIWSDGTTMYVVENTGGSASRDPQIHKLPLSETVVWEATLVAPTAWANLGTYYEGYGSPASSVVTNCIDRGHSLHMFGDMVDTIIGMTSLQGGGHAMEGDVRYVSEERVRGAGAG